MPCIKRKGGWKIKRGKGRGTYPKLYPTLKACQKRVAQIKTHAKIDNK